MTSELKKLIDIESHKKNLTDKSSHTKHKIRYVSEYVKEWLFVSCNSENDNINFIDCMCNAGVYLDGDLCTSIEVLKIFCQFASKNPDKSFNVLFNDINRESIRISKDVCNIEVEELPSNVHVYFDIKDVNKYIYDLKSKYGQIFTFPSKTILFVDPYDFRTVHIPTLKSFVQNTYCELIFNMFTSDFVRNGADDGITKALGEAVTFKSKEELWAYVADTLLVGKMRYCLSYPFRNSRNSELYQILFLTPSDKGLDKLKQAIWNTFDGQEYFKTSTSHIEQLSLFTPQDDKDYHAKAYAEEAWKMLQVNFDGQIISYETLSKFVLSHTLLMSSQVINYLIKPNIAKGNIVKQKSVNNNNNYRNDSYLIRGI